MKKIGLIVLHEQIGAAVVELLERRQLSTFGTYSGAISQAFSTSQIAAAGASTSVASLISTVSGRSLRSA